MELSLLFAILLLIPGIALAFIPVVPAILYSLTVVTGYVLISHFSRVSPGEFAVLCGVALLSLLTDQLAGLIGARWGGASRRALLFGFIGAVLGTLLGGPLMSFVGLFTGIFCAELLQLKPHLEAFRAAKGGLIGALIGWGITIVLAFVFFGLFIVFSLR